jgi:trigger factor
MQVTKVESKKLTHQFRVTTSAAELQTKFYTQLEKIGARVRIPGFRPGKAPKNILIQRYGADCWEDAGNAVLREAFEKINKENKFHSAVDPVVDVLSFEKDKDFECTITFEVMPEIEIKNLNDIPLEKLIVTISDQDVEARLKQMHAEHVRYKEPEQPRAAQKGDLVSVKWSGVLDDGKRVDLPETYQILLGPENGDSPFAPVVKTLYGKSVGYAFDQEIKFLNEEKVKDLAGKTAKIKVEVQKIEEPLVFKLDDAFAKEFDLETLEEMRQSVRTSVEHESQKVAYLYLKRHLLDALNDRCDFDLPPTLVDNEFKAIWGHLQRELADARANGELEEDDEKTEEELKEEYSEIAKRRVRLGLLISNLVERHKLSLTEEEIRMAIFQEAMRYPSQMEDVIRYFAKNKKALQNLIAPLLEDKVVELIIKTSNLTERHVDFTTLKKVVKGVIPTPYDDEEDLEEAKDDKAPKSAKPKEKRQAKGKKDS